jgi:hypothetical protein
VPIHFTEKLLELTPLAFDDILHLVALPNHPSDLLGVTKAQELWRINSDNGQCQKISCLSGLHLSEKTSIQIQVSRCWNYAAITRINRDDDTNYGFVIHLTTGEVIFELKDFDYHSELTVFPVGFFQNQNSCHMVYASDWNHLDIVNLQTGQCLTNRNNNEIPKQEREEALFTEWAGELKISPDNKRVATLGWAWHPVGLAWNFSLDKWLENKWESDFGKSKTQLGSAWDYFWHSPFEWLDNQRIIIWGDPESQDDNDIPADNVFICDAISGEQLFAFDGPTMDIFEVDGNILFSGTKDKSGISVWDITNGNLMDIYSTQHQPLTYLHRSNRFIAQTNDKKPCCIEWKITNQKLPQF